LTFYDTIKVDLNNDDIVDIKDIILCLQIISSNNNEKFSYIDMNGDKKIRIEEAVEIFQIIFNNVGLNNDQDQKKK